MSVAQYAKVKGAHLVRPKFSAENQQEIVKMMSQLSNNTNQIARALNTNYNFSGDRISTNLTKSNINCFPDHAKSSFKAVKELYNKSERYPTHPYNLDYKSFERANAQSGLVP